MDKKKIDVLLDFGELVKKGRYAMYLTQFQLAEETGLSVNYIGKIERGECNPSLITIATIAEALKLSSLSLGIMCNGW